MNFLKNCTVPLCRFVPIPPEGAPPKNVEKVQAILQLLLSKNIVSSV